MASKDTKVMTPVFRAAYPNLFKARRNDLSGKDEFSVVAVFKKGEDLTVLRKAAFAAGQEKWGEDRKKWPKNLRIPFRDQGDRGVEDDDGNMVMPDGYETGAIYMNLKSLQKPQVVDQDVQDILDSSLVYGGCYLKASINAYAYDAAGNRGIAFGLNNVQFVKDGKPFGNRTRAQDDFKPVAREDSDSSGDDLGADSMFL